MQIHHSLAGLAALHAPVHWAMGFFDGLHLGHKRVVESAGGHGALRGVLTFTPHPQAVLRPDKAPPLLTPHAAHKYALLQAMGVDVVLDLPFTHALAAVSAADFIAALCAACPAGVAGVSVGSDWRFGHGGGGTVELLRQLAPAYGFRVCGNDLLRLPSGELICSTAIRAKLAQGDTAAVQAMLGRPFEVYGTVERGQTLARKLGFPTANIALPRNAALPPFGAYAVAATVDGRLLHGVANLGLRPTIEEEVKVVRLETHFLDFEGDLYDRPLTISLLRFLRPERRFPSIDGLEKQIAADVHTVRQGCSLCPP